YNSQSASTNGPFGYGWAYNYGMSLSCSGTTATITQEDSGTTTCTTGGTCTTGTWTPSDPYTIGPVSYSGGPMTFKRHIQDTYTFNSSGQLTSMADLNGYTTNLTYSGGNLSTVTDPASRTLSFTWTGSNITTVTDSNVSGNTRTVTYGYTSGNLT